MRNYWKFCHIGVKDRSFVINKNKHKNNRRWPRAPERRGAELLNALLLLPEVGQSGGGRRKIGEGEREWQHDECLKVDDPSGVGSQSRILLGTTQLLLKFNEDVTSEIKVIN